MNQLSDPIAVFDSGMGGISVLKEMTKLMPDEDFIYFGDSRHAPYGTKTLEEVRRLTIEHITWLIKEKHAKAVAVACNTATSAAVRILRGMYPELPLVGVEPAIKPAVLSCKHARVLVMATPMTLREEKFQKLESLYDAQADIYPLPCPGLMEFVEQGILSGEKLEGFLHALLDPFQGKHITGIVLGCTHYPFLKETIQKIAGPSVTIFDGGLGTAKELLRRIREADLKQPDPSYKGTVTFLNSSDDPALIQRSKQLYKK
ncbi:MAG: glutamate racemase [Lachnospiraceae bacterium]|nr:glutamate racemase [Lachnospiraceae bacterium]MDY5496759.1 glutamate racemase [Anaerobutyricum sp.]